MNKEKILDTIKFNRSNVLLILFLVTFCLSCLSGNKKSDLKNTTKNNDSTMFILIEKSLNHNYLKDYHISEIPEPIYVYSQNKVEPRTFKIKCFNKDVLFTNNLDNILNYSKYKNIKNEYRYFQLYKYIRIGNEVFIELKFDAEGLFITALYKYENGKWSEKKYSCVET